tara:strand:+ start:5829 stop:6002 length:174 start_codon:yes stop_codon:yes gene_type:complete
MDFDNLTAQTTQSACTDAGMTLEDAFNQGIDTFAGYVAGLDEDDRAHLEAVVYEYAI